MPKKKIPRKELLEELQKEEGADAGEAPQQQAVELPPPKPKLAKLALGLGLVLFGATLIALALMGFSDEQKSNSTTTQTSKISNSNKVLCKGLGQRSIQCEDLATKEKRKYVVPDELGQVTRMVPNARGDKFFIESWLPKQLNEHLAIYDGSLELLHVLPAKFKKDNSTGDLHDINWLTDTTIFYSRRDEGAKPTTTIHSFDVTTGEETHLHTLYTSNAIYNDFFVSGDPDYVFVKALDQTDNGVSVLKTIKLASGEETNVDTTQLQTNIEELGYDPASKLFFSEYRDYDGDASLERLDIFTVDSPETQPKLALLASIDKVALTNIRAYVGVTVANGVLATQQIASPNAQIYRIYSSDGSYVESTLNPSVGKVSALFSTPSFPNLPAAETNELEVSDFFAPPANAPAKITAYLTDMVTNAPNCQPEERMNFELYKFDGDEQFSVLQSGCGTDGLGIYILQKSGTYKRVTISQEGVACEARDRLGISPKVVGCFKPGEGL